MSLRIVDCAGVSLCACATFEYRGFVVSASTVFAPNNSVLVFDRPTDAKPVSPEFYSVEDAINWIEEWWRSGGFRGDR